MFLFFFANLRTATQVAPRPREGNIPPVPYWLRASTSLLPTIADTGNKEGGVMPRDLPASSNLEHLRKQAKRLLRDFRRGRPAAVEQFRLLASRAPLDLPKLADAQHAVAREYGFDSWPKMKSYVELQTRKSNPDEIPVPRLIQAKEEEPFMPDQLTQNPGDDGGQDDLLPLYRKLRFETGLKALVSQAGEHSPLSLLFADLDHFKQVNDQYGHPVGNEVLIGVATAAKAVCANKGHCYRWGGEELAILLPNYTAAEAAALAERIRQAVSKLEFSKYPGKMTISVGVSCYPETSTTAERLVEHADVAMYKAKRAGRDRVVAAASIPDADSRAASRFSGVGGPQQPLLSVKTVFSRVQRARRELGREGKPCFSLAAWPSEPVDFPNLFESPEVPIVRLLEHPPRLRNNGFDLATRTRSIILEGQLRRCLVPQHKLLEVWRDGSLICTVPGDDWGLCWNTHSSAVTGLRINTLALAENVYLFCDWTIKAYENAVPAPPKMKIRMMLSDMTVNGKPFSLNPYSVSEVWLDHDRRPAPAAAPGVHSEIEISRVNAKPGVLAYCLLADLYSWFGFNAVEMPYINRGEQPPTVDTTQLT